MLILREETEEQKVQVPYYRGSKWQNRDSYPVVGGIQDHTLTDYGITTVSAPCQQKGSLLDSGGSEVEQNPGVQFWGYIQEETACDNVCVEPI